MNNARTMHGVMLALLVAYAIPNSTIHASPKGSQVLGAAALVLGASAGIYALGNWLFTPSDEEILKQEYIFETSLRQYEAVANYTDSASTAFFSDELLGNSSQLSCILDRPVNTLLSDLKADINTISSYRKDFAQRMQNKSAFYRDMQDADSRLASWSVKLERTYAVIKAHFNYFELCQAAASLRARYSKEITLASYYGNDIRGYQLALKEVIKTVTQGSAYPYLTYVDRLTHDKNYLDACISKALYAYQAKAHECQQLSSIFEKIKTTVMSDREYERALLERERDRLAQEKLALQQQLIAQQAHNMHLIHQLNTPPVQQVVVHEVVEYEPAPAHQVIVHHEYSQEPQQQVVYHHVVQPEEQNYTVHHEYVPYASPAQETVVHHHNVKPEEHVVYHHVVQSEEQEDLVGPGYDDNHDDN